MYLTPGTRFRIFTATAGALLLSLAGCADPCLDDGLGQDNRSNCPTAVSGDAGMSGGSDDATGGMGSDDLGIETDTNGGTLYCTDQDEDGQGNPNDCVGVPDGNSPPTGSVPNNDDCVDDDPTVYEGAAEGEPDLCTSDEDGDGYGDANPPTGADPGSDCDDSSPTTYPGAGENESPPLDAMCVDDADGDGYGDSAPDNPDVTPGTDCNDTTELVGPECLTVETTACLEADPITGAQLTSTVSGGTGDVDNYSYLWSPAETLNQSTIANPIAFPDGLESYTVTVSDGFNQATDTTTVVSLDPFNLRDRCQLYQFSTGVEPPATITYNDAGTQACETINGNVGIHLCDVVFEDTQLQGSMFVNLVNPSFPDNDNIGFIWGAQDESHFYIFSWKRSDQEQTNQPPCPNAPNFLWPGGMMVKRVEADSIAALTREELFCDYDTDEAERRSTVLLSPSDLTTEGWNHNVTYDVLLNYRSTGTNIEIRDENGEVIIDFVVDDTTFTRGRFGTITYSQSGACNGPWHAACLVTD